jgi:hypothetical protein
MVRPVDRSDELPYEVTSSVLREGDEVIDHRPDGDGDTVEYRVEQVVVDDVCEKEYRHLGNACVDVLTYLDGELVNSRSFFGDVFRCEVTGNVFVTGEAVNRSPRTCPECGANAELEDVDECTDAHALEGSQDDAHGAHDARGDEDDARDAQADGQPQTTLSGFTGN